MRSRMALVAFRLQSTMLERARGHLDQGIAVMEQSVEEMPSLTAFRCILTSLFAERGRDGEARALLEEIAATGFEILPDNDKLYGWALLGEVCHVLGDGAHARTLYELLLPYAKRNVVCHPGCAIGSASRYLGLLAMLLGRFDDANRHFETAIDANEKMGARPWLALAQEEFARMLLERGGPGDREKALTLLDAAVTTYRDLGMTGPLTRAESVVVTS
jgi:tetratricopeptide (TPR) repeat protein